VSSKPWTSNVLDGYVIEVEFEVCLLRSLVLVVVDGEADEEGLLVIKDWVVLEIAQASWRVVYNLKSGQSLTAKS
jgi:hypothetical protein